jgi:protein-S-isoprenylcysteine O-methyltransferase Ste14
MNTFILLSGTIVIIVLSWFISLKDKRYHGIARFFSFEAIFILFLKNYKAWFIDPLTLHQVLSWILLVASIYPVTSGFILLKKEGKPEKGFENTTVLIKTGVYKYIRHPLYCSLMLLGTGIMLKDPGVFQAACGIINIIALYFTARIEEKEMITRFGDQYVEYMKSAKMFIPLVA